MISRSISRRKSVSPFSLIGAEAARRGVGDDFSELIVRQHAGEECAAHAVAQFAAQQRMQRQADRFAQDVPARRLDRREEDLLVEVFLECRLAEQPADAIDLARVDADQRGPQVVRVERAHRLRGERQFALAPAGQAGIGAHLSEIAVDVNGEAVAELVRARCRRAPGREGHSAAVDLEVGDLHAHGRASRATRLNGMRRARMREES
jgi:hypothetical protein